MEIRWAVVLLALLQSIQVLAHNNYHNTAESNVKQKAFNSILHNLSKREIHCPEDEYPAAETLCCKLCNAGTYAESDCTKDHGYPNCEDCIKGVNYMDEKNGYHSCHTCSKCDSESGQEEQQACNVRQNTVCRCSRGFFCTDTESTVSDGCRKCQHCTECEHGYDEECAATKDAVCKIQKPKTSHFGLIALIAIPCLLALITGIYYIARRKFNICSHPQPGSQGNANRDNNLQSEIQPLVLPENLIGVGLTDRHLLAFAEIMDHETVLLAVRNMGILEPKIEEIRCNNSDHFEKKYQLLREWHQSQGDEATLQNLITTLENKRKHQIAKQLIELTQNLQRQSQC